jgi:hypothetical protein
MQAPILDSISKKFNNNYKAFVEDVYARSIFASADKFFAFLDKPNVALLENDPAMEVCGSFLQYFMGNYRPQIVEIQSRIEKGNRAFVAGLREMMPEKKFYPNANSTMRLTYGQVKDYDPRDGVEYNEYTTLKGVVEKEDASNPEFFVPAGLKELYKKKDYGIYGEKDELHTCFISTNDITGGNSGSPAIDAKGNLIGLNFDRVWEGTMSDIFYSPEICRNIMVDIRYVLFIVDKYANAENLIKELKIIPSN